MSKIVALLVAAMFAFVTMGTFAADGMRKDVMAKQEMTKDNIKVADKPAKKAKKSKKSKKSANKK